MEELAEIHYTVSLNLLAAITDNYDNYDYMRTRLKDKLDAIHHQDKPVLYFSSCLAQRQSHLVSKGREFEPYHIHHRFNESYMAQQYSNKLHGEKHALIHQG